MSPYGESKLIGEWLIGAAARAHGIRAASLRYFNVAGAGAGPELADTGVFNLIPMVFERLEAGEAPRIFGADYNTPDGTCVRDYIHVQDIASAHLAAARRLQDAPAATSLVLNIGRGEGSSIREMVDRILKLTGHDDADPEVTERRPGDPARVVASADRIHQELGWSARHGLDELIESACRGGSTETASWMGGRRSRRWKRGSLGPSRHPAPLRTARSRRSCPRRPAPPACRGGAARRAAGRRGGEPSPRRPSISAPAMTVGSQSKIIRVLLGADGDAVARADALHQLRLDAEAVETVGEVTDGLVVVEVGLADPAFGLLAAHVVGASSWTTAASWPSSTAFGG